MTSELRASSTLNISEVEQSPETESENQEKELERLASLAPVTYEQEREQAAKSLGVRVSVLDKDINQRRKLSAEESSDEGNELFSKIEPWDQPVDGQQLLNELTEAVRRHAILPECAPEAIALWAVFSHAHETARHSPVLAITSPEKGCGKTTVLAIVEQLVPKPLPSSNITTAAIYRSIEMYEPTLLIDEADTFLTKSDDMRGVLNSGHRKTSAFVIRSVGEDHTPHRFKTWAPKAIAAIGDLPETLADRSINIQLRRRLPDEAIEEIDELAEEKLKTLSRKIVRWVNDNLAKLKEGRPKFPNGLRDRVKDNWRTMLVIAELAGGAWPELAQKAAAELSATEEEGNFSLMLLSDIRDIFVEKSVEFLSSQALATKLWSKRDGLWSEWNRNRGMNPRSLSKMLKPFGIRPEVVRIGEKTPRGYKREWFEDTWQRYLTANPMEEPQQCNNATSSDLEDSACNLASLLNQKIDVD